MERDFPPALISIRLGLSRNKRQGVTKWEVFQPTTDAGEGNVF